MENGKLDPAFRGEVSVQVRRLTSDADIFEDCAREALALEKRLDATGIMPGQNMVRITLEAAAREHRILAAKLAAKLAELR